MPPPRQGEVRGLSALVRHSVVYSAVPVVSRALSFLLVPFYTAFLPEEQYGVNVIGDFVLIGLAQLLGQNLLGGMVRFYFDHEDERRRAAVVSSCTIVLAAVAWIVCGSILAFREELVPVLVATSQEVEFDTLRTVLTLLVLIVPFQLSTLAGLHYLQIRQRSKAYSSIQIAKMVVEVGLKIWMIGWLGWGVVGLFAGVLVGEVLVATGLTGWLLVRLGPRIDWSVLRPIAVYAAPLVPVGLLQLLLHQFDRRLVEHLAPEAGLHQAGVYGLGYQVGYLVTALMLGPFLQIWQPWIYRVTDAREQALLLSRVSTYAVLAVATASIGVILFGREAILLLGQREGYQAAYVVVPWVASAYVLWALYQVTQVPLFVAKRTGRLLLVNAIAVAVNVGTNLWLIPRHGFLGAALATNVTFVLLACMGMAACWSVLHVPFELGRILAVIGCVAVAAAAAIQIDHLAAEGLWPHALTVAAKLAIALLLGLVLARGVLRRDERGRLLAWLRTLPFAPAGAPGAGGR